MTKQRVNDCLNCTAYKTKDKIPLHHEIKIRKFFEIEAFCNKGHNYDGVIKSAFNYGFDIECNDFRKKEEEKAND
jgi:hypothetical protein